MSIAAVLGSRNRFKPTIYHFLDPKLLEVYQVNVSHVAVDVWQNKWYELSRMQIWTLRVTQLKLLRWFLTFFWYYGRPEIMISKIAIASLACGEVRSELRLDYFVPDPICDVPMGTFDFELRALKYGNYNRLYLPW